MKTRRCSHTGRRPSRYQGSNGENNMSRYYLPYSSEALSDCSSEKVFLSMIFKLEENSTKSFPIPHKSLLWLTVPTSYKKILVNPSLCIFRNNFLRLLVINLMAFLGLFYVCFFKCSLNKRN